MASGLFYHDALDALSREGVRFVVVGGVAVNLRGVPRFTADLDIAAALDLDNVQRIVRALSSLGLHPRLPEDPEKLADPETLRVWVSERNLKAFTFQDRSNPLRQVDVLVASPLPYEQIDATATEIRAAALSFRVASAAVLIAMKAGTGRAQDAADIDALRRVGDLGDG